MKKLFLSFGLLLSSVAIFAAAPAPATPSASAALAMEMEAMMPPSCVDALAYWALDGSTSATTTATDVTGGVANFGPGVNNPVFDADDTPNNPGAYKAEDWGGTNEVRDDNDYIEFCVTSTERFYISEFSFMERREVVTLNNGNLGSRGPQNLDVFYSTDNFATRTQVGSTIELPDDAEWRTQTFSGLDIIATNATICFRIYGYDTDSFNGDAWRFDDVNICGSVCQVEAGTLDAANMVICEGGDPGLTHTGISGNGDALQGYNVFNSAGVLVAFADGLSTADLQTIEDFLNSAAADTYTIVADVTIPADGTVGDCARNGKQTLDAWLACLESQLCSDQAMKEITILGPNAGELGATNPVICEGEDIVLTHTGITEGFFNSIEVYKGENLLMSFDIQDIADVETKIEAEGPGDYVIIATTVSVLPGVSTPSCASQIQGTLTEAEACIAENMNNADLCYDFDRLDITVLAPDAGTLDATNMTVCKGKAPGLTHDFPEIPNNAFRGYNVFDENGVLVEFADGFAEADLEKIETFLTNADAGVYTIVADVTFADEGSDGDCVRSPGEIGQLTLDEWLTCLSEQLCSDQAMKEITILNVGCGTFPWQGNE